MLNVDQPPVQVQLVALPLLLCGLERLVLCAAPRLALAGSAGSVAAYLAAPQHPAVQVVVLDLDGEDGTESLADLHRQTKAKILVITGSQDATLRDSAVLAGARSVVDRRQAMPTLLRAIESVHAGDIWIDHRATNRIVLELVREKAAKAKDPEQRKIASLTGRERQTIETLTSEASLPGKLVAERLHISEHTLRNHLTSIYGKLGLTNRMDLYVYARKHGLSKTPET